MVGILCWLSLRIQMSRSGRQRGASQPRRCPSIQRGWPRMGTCHWLALARTARPRPARRGRLDARKLHKFLRVDAASPLAWISAGLRDDEVVCSEVGVLLVEAARNVVLGEGALQAVEQGVLRLPTRHIARLRVKVYNLGRAFPGRLGAKLRHAVEGDELLAGHIVDVALHSWVSYAPDHEVGQVLAMAQLRDVLPVPRDAHGPVPAHAVEEETLHRVVVQGPVDVDRPD